jgi:DNA-binding transcriptional LysR family regulator
MRMNVTNLRSFLAVAECGGFTSAATRHGIAQPTLTRQVRELEERYGVKLFERSGRGVRLTEAGTQLQDYARRAFDELDKADGYLRMRARSELSVYSVRNEKLSSFIEMICGRVALADVRVSMMASRQVYDGLVTGACDFGMLTVPEDAADVDAFEIGTYPVLAYVAEKHPWRGAGEISLRDLEGQPILIAKRTAQTRLTFERETKRLGVAISILQEVDNFDVMIALVEAGRGIGIMGSVGQVELREAHALRFREAGMTQKLHLAVGPRDRRSPLATGLFEVAKETLRAAR